MYECGCAHRQMMQCALCLAFNVKYWPPAQRLLLQSADSAAAAASVLCMCRVQEQCQLLACSLYEPCCVCSGYPFRGACVQTHKVCAWTRLCCVCMLCVWQGVYSS